MNPQILPSRDAAARPGPAPEAVAGPARVLRPAGLAGSPNLLDRCAVESLRLLQDNLTPQGILAASPTEAAEARRYTRIFGRDAAICVLAMAGSGVEPLERGALASIDALARAQAPNGQIPKYVDPEGQDADFWYLGCIDATLWWLIAVDHLRRHSPLCEAQGGWEPQVRKAIAWLQAQEHQRFFLLQQNEASDWADIMPRSGFVLYTNALWYRVKVLFGLPHAAETRANFNRLFHPFSAALPEYRRARLLSDYVQKKAKNRELFLSFVNFSFFGEEGDVLGNLLAILAGAADRKASRRVLDALLAAGVHEPYPVRAVVTPIPKTSMLWRPYMARHRQNYAWQYHNGGVWPMIGAFWILALVRAGFGSLARAELTKLAASCAVRGWRFSEWLHGRTLGPRGMPGQSWSAAGFLLAQHVIDGGDDPFDAPARVLGRGMVFA